MASQYPAKPDALVLSAGMRRITVTTPSTVELRDLASLRRDFALAAAFLGFYLDGDLEGDQISPSAIDALWISSVTMYGRAFSSGKRHHARADTDGLDSNDVAAHGYFLDTRNKFIAHAVNGFETGAVFADLLDPLSAKGIARIGEVHTSLSRLSREAATTLKRLCEHQVQRLTLRIDALHQVVARELLNMGADAVYDLPDFKEPVIDSSDPRSKRL
ncbi:hypothetical protein [Microbacterium sp. K35]|uniref:hypothetical protein n=1 Tax=Microbacterium sp. K35 TaxID=2305440 RepID=UPI00109BB1C1|nr:hypothetical protein [Microbacterium sp. K35]